MGFPTYAYIKAFTGFELKSHHKKYTNKHMLHTSDIFSQQIIQSLKKSSHIFNLKILIQC